MIVAEELCRGGHCITCSDEAVELVVLDASDGLALCEDGAGARSTVQTELVEPVAAGDRVLVHAGTAIACVRSPG